MYNLNSLRSNFVKIYCSSVGRTCTFLLDTQAGISILKHNLIKSNTITDPTIVNIQGITNETVPTLGLINTNFKIYDFQLPHNLHLVPEEFPIPADGILGDDFINKFRCILNFSNMTLTIPSEQNYLHIPICRTEPTPEASIPPRCEVFRIVNIGNVTGDRVVHAQEIAKDIFVARGIISSAYPIVRMVNTRNESFTPSSQTCIKTSALSDYNIVSNTISSTDRKETVMNILRPNFPKISPTKLETLCKNYTDIFALDDEKLSVNNFYKQKITLQDNTPVYIKNYRLPHTQKLEVKRQVDKMLQNDTIEPSISCFNSPIILVPKKSTDGE